MSENNETMQVQKELLGALAKTGFFSCFNCEELLTGVVMLVSNVGNVCEKCYKSTYMNNDFQLHSVLTSLTEVIINEVEIPCKNSAKGCKWMSPNNKMKDHERTCIYRERECLFSIMDTKDVCDWKGSLNMLENHIVETHKESVVITEYSDIFTFSINVDLNGLNGDNFTFLKTDSKSFILKLSLDSESNCLKYVLYKTFIDELPNSYTIKCQGSQENRCFQLDAPLRPLCWIYSFPEKMESINLNGLQQIKYDTKQFELILEIDSCQVVEEPNTEIEPNLNNVNVQIKGCDCPVCLNPMRPPIYVCTRGHSICNTCKSNITICPKCKSSMSNIRNFDLEDLLSINTFPCLFEEKGCNESLIFDEIVKHEKNCRFKTYICPFGNSTGTSVECLNHFIKDHAENVTHGDRFSDIISVLFSESDYFGHCLIFCDEVFLLTGFENEKVIYFGVEVIHGSTIKSSKYKYTVTIKSKLYNKWAIFATDSCIGMKISSTEYRKNFIGLPLSQFPTIINNTDAFTFDVLITKI